jgi:purine-binding chemotaxis protein CheW
MVDLVKIRRKAKEKAEKAAKLARAAVTPSVPEPPPEPAAAARESIVAPAAEQASAPVVAVERPTGKRRRTARHDDAEGLSPAERLRRFIEQVGTPRAGSVPSEVSVSSGTEVELLTFLVGEETYGIDIGCIVQIVAPRPVTRVPNADPSIIGIMSLRGTMVTLLDIRRRLRHSATPAGNESRIIVVERRGEIVGFPVDKVVGRMKADLQHIEPPPALHPGDQSEYVMGVFRDQNSLTILLEVERLLSA